MIPQDIIYAVSGQALYYDPPEMFQPTGTPTATVYFATNDDGTAAESATTGNCSVDSVSTTFSADAGDTQITVASGTGIARGRRYLVTDVDGDCEWVDVLSVNGTTVGLRMPLINNYAASSTFKGCRISISVSNTWAADASNISDILDPNGRAWRTDEGASAWIAGAQGYRVRWAYTVNGTDTIGVSYFDLVRYPAKNLVSPLDVDARCPGWIDRLTTDYRRDQGVALINDAYQAIKIDALGDNQVIRRLRDTQVIRELVIYRANLLAQEAAMMVGATNMELVRAAQDLYDNRFNRLVREPKVPADQTGGGASAQAERLPAWRR